MTVDQQSPHAVSLTKPSDLEFRVERTPENGGPAGGHEPSQMFIAVRSHVSAATPHPVQGL